MGREKTVIRLACYPGAAHAVGAHTVPTSSFARTAIILSTAAFAIAETRATKHEAPPGPNFSNQIVSAVWRHMVGCRTTGIRRRRLRLT